MDGWVTNMIGLMNMCISLCVCVCVCVCWSSKVLPIITDCLSKRQLMVESVGETHDWLDEHIHVQVCACLLVDKSATHHYLLHLQDTMDGWLGE